MLNVINTGSTTGDGTGDRGRFGAFKLNAWLSEAVLDKDLNDPPASPSNFDRYIVGSNPTGAWANRAGQIAVWLGSWQFTTPGANDRTTVYVIDEDAQYRWDGTAWVPAVSPDNLVAILNQSDDALQTTHKVTVTATTDIEDAGNAVNTAGKLRGTLVISGTDNKLYWATGAGATDAWQAADGSGSLTPS